MDTFICGVCKQEKTGKPSGGFNTIYGEVITCSGDCWIEGMKTGKPVSRNEMICAMTHNGEVKSS